MKERERTEREEKKVDTENKQTNKHRGGKGRGELDWRQKIQKIEIRYRRDCLCTRARNK